MMAQKASKGIVVWVLIIVVVAAVMPAAMPAAMVTVSTVCRNLN